MEGENLGAVRFATAAAANRRIAGLSAAGRRVQTLAERQEITILLGDRARLAPATIDDVERLRGRARIAVRHGAVEADDPLPSAWQIVRATGKQGDGPVSRWLNRPISQRISWLLLAIPGVRPLHVTLFNALLALVMTAALLRGGETGLVVGGLLFQAASVLDGVDGEIARATYRTSRAGAALDTLIDAATNFLFLLGVMINLMMRGEPLAAGVGGWGIGLFAIGLAVLSRRARRAPGPFSFDLLKPRRRFANRLFGALVGFLTIVSSRDFFALLFALLILAGEPMAVLYIFAAAASIWFPLIVATSLAPLLSAAAVSPRR